MSFVLSSIKSLGLKVWAWVAGGALVVFTLYRIYKEGERGAKVKSLEDTLHSVKRRQEIESNVDGLSDDDVASKLRDGGWIRDR